jgi:hypothetical protein
MLFVIQCQTGRQTSYTCYSTCALFFAPDRREGLRAERTTLFGYDRPLSEGLYEYSILKFPVGRMASKTAAESSPAGAELVLAPGVSPG